jgi:hypothetical protein
MPFKFIEDADLREKAESAHKIEVDSLTVNLTNASKTAVEEAVTGLKTKNAEILDEKKVLSESMKKFEGIDLDAVKVATDFYTKNKDTEFLKDGTVEELIEKKTSQLTSDFETKIGELTGKLTTATDHGATYQSLFESKVIDDGVRAAAIKAGMLDTAVDDAILRGRSVFSLDENKQIEARDAEGKLAVTDDKKVLNTANWIEGLKITSPHYWPGSTGAGATGTGAGPASDLTTKLNELAQAGKMDEYRALRDKHKKK